MTTIEMIFSIRKSGKYAGLIAVPFAHGAGWMLYSCIPEIQHIAKLDNKPKTWEGKQVMTIKQAFKLCVGV